MTAVLEDGRNRNKDKEPEQKREIPKQPGPS